MESCYRRKTDLKKTFEAKSSDLFEEKSQKFSTVKPCFQSKISKYLKCYLTSILNKKMPG